MGFPEGWHIMNQQSTPRREGGGKMNLSKELMKLVHDGVIFKRLGGEITRKELMDQLYITEEMVTNKSQAVIEKLFCVAVLNQGADITSKILEEYSKMVKCLEGE